jgi:hypothetical protein
VGSNPGSKLESAREEGTTVLEIETPEAFEKLIERGLVEASAS